MDVRNVDYRFLVTYATGLYGEIILSLEELQKAEEMATDLATYLEEIIGDEWLEAEAGHIARQLQERISEL